MATAVTYFQNYHSLEPDPKLGSPDQRTIALLHRLNIIVFTGAATFLDIVLLIRRFTPRSQTLTVIPSEFHILDQLHSHYVGLIGSAERAHGSCAKYLLCCRRALSSVAINSCTSSNGTTELERALEEFKGLCSEVRTSVDEVIDCWDETARILSNRDGTRLPILWQLLSSLAPNFTPITRQALPVEFPSLREKGVRNLRQFSDAYDGLEAIITQMDAVRVYTNDPGATVEVRRNLKIALLALVQLQYEFRRYKIGLFIVKGDWRLSLGDLLVDRLLAVEKDWSPRATTPPG
ncbi:hypothetical protein MVEN_01675700 [Mycena venus]|uniref:Uncharacterized protein n=1 Tax=Mycena venus TaxID=2733690 RepID=A0A8H7CR34_9AGAR|nr:hypothetical protein MVEN_01675700 [Mycena venus]